MDLRTSDIATPSFALRDQRSCPAWGPFATLVWTVLIAITFIVVQFAASLFYFAATAFERPRPPMVPVVAGLKFDGMFLSVCTFATLFFCAPLIIVIVKLKPGARIRDYLALNFPSARQVWRWTLVTIAFCLLTDAILMLLQQPNVPEFMRKVYSTMDPRWVLWLALAVGAPLFEELCFRGFIFTGLAASRLRWYGATVITSMLWAAIHVQYDWYGVSFIFGFGLLLGTVRAKTNSVVLTMWLHCLSNIIATLETAIALR
jgi:uncharacterized protein